jgi:hypothetical protein
MPASTPSGNRNDPADQAARMSRQMTTFMPLFFGFLALTYSSGLSIYFITSNIIGVIQYALMGKADVRRLVGREAPPKEEKAGPAMAANTPAAGASGIEPAKARPTRQLRPGISDIRLTGSSVTAGGDDGGGRSRQARQTGRPSRSRSRSSRSRSRPKSK